MLKMYNRQHDKRSWKVKIMSPTLATTEPVKWILQGLAVMGEIVMEELHPQ